METRIKLLLAVLAITILSSCKKDWLDQKRDISLVVPTTLSDMRQLLRNSIPQGYECRGLTELAAGDFYLTTTNYQAIASQIEKSGYLWKDDLFAGVTSIPEWDYNYQQVLTANLVLEGLSKLSASTNTIDYNDVKGEALYMRSRAFFNLAQLFGRPYDPKTAGNDPGIPLRTVSDVNAPSARATVLATYQRILSDLQTASGLVKVIADSRVDPSRAAVYGLLARCLLTMSDYDNAYKYADLSLKDYSKLINYNTLTVTSTRPFTVLNDEVVMPGFLSSSLASLKVNVGKVDSTLFASYDVSDLRRSLFFVKNTDGTYSFKGQYSGSTLYFGGIATDEMFLIRAECAARKGDANAAIDDLNTLLGTRYKTNAYVPYHITDAGVALSLILKERRKELVYRGLRWSDLRRLNKDPLFATTLTRVINGQSYVLPPNDPHYTFLIPDYVIKLSGIQQNSR